MKKLVIISMLLAFAGSSTLAVAADTITVKAKNGNVTFKHEGHGGANCAVCHGAGTPGKLGALGKEKGHALCIDCHKVKAAGPTKCGECHKK